MIPSNIMEFVGQDDRLDEIIEKVAHKPDRTPDEVKNDLHQFSWLTRIKVQFKAPTLVIYGGRMRYKEVTEHTFAGLFLGRGNELYYLLSRRGRRGYHLPFDMIQSYELVNVNKRDLKFKDFEEFQEKFDLRYIGIDYIKNLWASKSAQHGGQYHKGDFKRIGPVGKRVLKDFLRNFRGISEGGGPGYIERDGHYTLEARHSTGHHLGRDIRISHQTNVPCVFYSSEYQGCGNGRYGLLANEHEFLWLEDD